jgi:multidrug resistance efflux pump
MLELLFCSMLTVLPDYLYRRYVQGKRIGREITLFSVWYELRWGIVTCLFLTVSLITIVFYYHPSTKSATAFFRTITILPETGGRVAEIFVGYGDRVEAGAPLFRLDSTAQEAALETDRRRIAEIDAAIVVAQTELAASDGRIQEARSAYIQAEDELATKTDLRARNESTVALREIEKLKVLVDGRQGALSAALASKQSVEAQIATLLPAQKASAEAALSQAQVDLDKRVIYAGVTGTVEQFTLQVGDFVTPIGRPAGILIPDSAGRLGLAAGFGQIEAQVIKPGMIAEVTCIAKPFAVVPMVVTNVQDFIAAGQVRATDQLIDPSQATTPGTLTVFLEPLFAGGLDGVPPGSSCIANAYTNNHDLLESENLSATRWLFLHAVDAVGLVHAAILRLQALLLPFQTLVFSGGH